MPVAKRTFALSVLAVTLLGVAGTVTALVLSHQDDGPCDAGLDRGAGTRAPVPAAAGDAPNADLDVITSFGPTLRFVTRLPNDAGVTTVTVGPDRLHIDAFDWFGAIDARTGATIGSYGADGSLAVAADGTTFIAADVDTLDGEPGTLRTLRPDGSQVECRVASKDLGETYGDVHWSIGTDSAVALQGREMHVYDTTGHWRRTFTIGGVDAGLVPIVLGDRAALIDPAGARSIPYIDLTTGEQVDGPAGIPQDGSTLGEPVAAPGGAVVIDWLPSAGRGPQGPLVLHADGRTATALDEIGSDVAVIGDELWLLDVGDESGAVRLDPATGAEMASDAPLAAATGVDAEASFDGDGRAVNDGTSAWTLSDGALVRLSLDGVERGPEFTSRSARLFAGPGTLVVVLFEDQSDGTFIPWMAVFDT